MKNLKLSGFTLIESLCAMIIIGISVTSFMVFAYILSAEAPLRRIKQMEEIKTASILNFLQQDSKFLQPISNELIITIRSITDNLKVVKYELSDSTRSIEYYSIVLY